MLHSLCKTKDLKIYATKVESALVEVLVHLDSLLVHRYCLVAVFQVLFSQINNLVRCKPLFNWYFIYVEPLESALIFINFGCQSFECYSFSMVVFWI